MQSFRKPATLDLTDLVVKWRPEPELGLNTRVVAAINLSSSGTACAEALIVP